MPEPLNLGGRKDAPQEHLEGGNKDPGPWASSGAETWISKSGEGSPHSPLWNVGVLGARPPRAPRILFRLGEGSGPQGSGASSVPARRPHLGGRETATESYPDSSAPPARPYCARGEGARCSQGPRREASPSPGPLHPGPRPPPRDSPWIARGPDPPLPASKRTTRGKKEEAPADSAIVTTAAAAAQQRPARARAPGASPAPAAPLPPPSPPPGAGTCAPGRAGAATAARAPEGRGRVRAGACLKGECPC